MRPKYVCILIIGLLPSSRLKNSILKFIGWKISSGAKIGPNIFLEIGDVCIGRNVLIRPFNVFRNVSLDFSDDAIFGSLNWVGAARGLMHLPNFTGILSMGKHSAINSRNYFDVSGGVRIGNFSDLAGVRSTLITHQINLELSTQTCNQIDIGDHTMICSNTKLVPGGTRIGDRCLIAMGSIVTAGEYPNDGFYAGCPATLRKMTSGQWFHRGKGSV
jgi:acetyltransferase-like isoleucine patch superfamily enzyme